MSLNKLQQCIDWGWRIPFLLGIFILFAGLFIKNEKNNEILYLESTHIP